jgi:hypothetical protein
MDCGQCLPCQLSLALPEAGMRFPMYRTRALSMIFSPGKRVHVLGFYDAGRISRIATLSSDARCAYCHPETWTPRSAERVSSP